MATTATLIQTTALLRISEPEGHPPLGDLKGLFEEVLNKEYSKEAYNKQFTTRIPEHLAKTERVAKVFESVSDAPKVVFTVLEEQKKRLLAAREKQGDYILPEQL